MKNATTKKLEAITETTMIVGIDIAKNEHWAQFVNWRGISIGKPMKFKNNKAGFEDIVAEVGRRRKQEGLDKVVLGMEPTGPYWKALAWWLKNLGLGVVTVNTHNTKLAKSLDDNSQTKSDSKDALVIARLVKDGRYFEPYLPDDVYGELRVTSNSRISLMKRQNAIKNRVIGMMDEYFPEFSSVFKTPLKGIASMHLLKTCPFPEDIIGLGYECVLKEVKSVVKKTVGQKRVTELMQAAQESVGVTYGSESASMQMRMQMEELELLMRHQERIEERMEELLEITGFKDLMLGIDGIGVVTAASFLGEVGDPMRFDNARQIHRLAGYNLIENSSGKNKSGTSISKRGRKQLRAILYKASQVMVRHNSELNQLYKHLTTREKNPLKRKQALVVICKKLITIIYQILKQRADYKPELVLGTVRKQQLGLAA